MEKEMKNVEEQKGEKKEQNKKPKINKELEILKNERDALQDKVLRVSAELQNSIRRNEEEISRIRKYEGSDIIKDVLPIIDNFERAIKLDDANLEDELSKFLSGFKMIYTNFLNILTKYEVREIDCKDKEFNPAFMEAVLTEKIEGIEKNMVVEVLQKGYTYKDKLLRPAMVKVSE